LKNLGGEGKKMSKIKVEEMSEEEIDKLLKKQIKEHKRIIKWQKRIRKKINKIRNAPVGKTTITELEKLGYEMIHFWRDLEYLLNN